MRTNISIAASERQGLVRHAGQLDDMLKAFLIYIVTQSIKHRACSEDHEMGLGMTVVNEPRHLDEQIWALFLSESHDTTDDWGIEWNPMLAPHGCSGLSKVDLGELEPVVHCAKVFGGHVEPTRIVHRAGPAVVKKNHGPTPE